MTGNYDVFISYRRQGGDARALFIREKLLQKGVRVFLDVTDLKKGYFDEALLTYIAEAPSFIVILSPHSLDRCEEEGDWLRQEIAQAVRTNRNIIPVMMAGFTFSRELPPDIRPLPRHQGVEYSHAYFEAMISRIFNSIEAQRVEGERLARERAEAARRAAEQAEAERKTQERAERDRIAREKAEAEREARAKQEQERLAWEKAKAEALATQQALKAAEDRAARERREQAEQETQAKAEAERAPKARPSQEGAVVTPRKPGGGLPLYQKERKYWAAMVAMIGGIFVGWIWMCAEGAHSGGEKIVCLVFLFSLGSFLAYVLAKFPRRRGSIRKA